MSDDAARLARLYPTMQAPTESAPARPAHVQADTSAQAGTTVPPAADGFGDTVHTQSHPLDMAARRYPQMVQPDPVAQAIADKAKGEPEAALVEVIPENIKALRENDAAARLYPETYSQALNVLPEGFERGVASRWAFDVGIATSDLQTFMNDTRATLAGTPVPTDPVSDTDRADALALIARDSRFSDFMTKTNMVNHPRALVMFANLAREQRSRGRL